MSHLIGASVRRFSPVNFVRKIAPWHYPLAPSNVPLVTGGDMLAHFDKVFLNPSLDAPVLDSLDHRSREKQAENQSPPHDQALVG
jgi:hypothetical protein